MKTHLVVKNVLVLIFSILMSLYFSATLVAQESFHTFTNKKGQEIEAQLISIAPDMKMAKIKIKGSNEVPLDILTLSLDDQQYLKNWLKTNPVKMDFDLELTFSKDVVDKKKYDVANYYMKFIRENTKFDIEIKNRTRAILTGATIEYYIITEHVVNSYTNNNNRSNVVVWFYPIDNYNRKQPGDRDRKKIEYPISLNYGKLPMADVKVRFSTKVITDTIAVREITNDSNKSIAQDNILGVIAKVTDKNGNELGVYLSSGYKFPKKSWAEISQMPPGDPSGQPPMMRLQNNN